MELQLTDKYIVHFFQYSMFTWNQKKKKKSYMSDQPT